MAPGAFPHVWCGRCEQPVTWQAAACVPGERAIRVTVRCHGETVGESFAEGRLDGFAIVHATAFLPEGVSILVKEAAPC